MMQQGLGALVPQQPAGQAPENPVRMAAAMDVVTSDAEENILDPRTLALIKYKDAVAAMQAADQLMAASQPTPTPPTVAERTKLAAQQGIMGLASRLAPGLQQQGSRMAAAQAQQAMGGGLPQLSAPNMAGMAGGGIVGYAEGGGPLPTAGGREEDYVVTYDELGNPIYASDIARASAAGITDTSEEGAVRRAENAALQAERPNLREIARTPERPTASEERVPTAGYGMGDRTGQGAALAGMASGVVDSVRSGLGSLVPTGMSDEGGSMTRRGLRTPVEGDADSGRSSSARTGRAADAPPDVPVDEGVAQLLDSGPRRRRRGPRERVDYDVMGTLKELFGSQRNPVDRRGRPTGAPKPTTEPAADAPTAAPTAASDAVDVLFDQPSPSETGPVRRFDQPRPGETGPNATPAEYFRNQFRPAKAAAGADATTAAPQSRDDRMRRIIAGLRGLGAQGIGGFAAGVSDEELRMEQELIAEEERKNRAAAETRQLDLEERGLTQRDAILRLEIENQQREAQQMMDLRYEQLAATHGAAVADAINEKTAFLVPRAIELRTVLADPSYETGWFGKREELEAELAKLEATISATEAEVSALFGPAPARATAIDPAMQGVGSGAGSFNANDFTVRTVTP